MSLNPQYITGVELQDYFVDKDTGLPLDGGLVYFYSDNNRNQFKPVYQLSGSPPNYSYTPLLNPIVLSSVGTFQDDDGNDIAVYYYPYDSFGNVENYYIQVYSASTPPPGQPQFTREAWPNITQETSPEGTGNPSTENAISNPQFAEVLFDPIQGMTISYSGGGATTSILIAPDWTLNITASTGGTLTVARTSIAGSLQIPTNPPYTLTVAAGGNITNLTLSQRLFHNPDIWSAVTPGIRGYVSASVLLAPSTGTVSVSYFPSTTSLGPQEIVTGSNATGNWLLLNGTIQLAPGDNTQTSDTGYVDIVVNLPTSGTTQISSIQVVGTDDNVGMVQFDQQPVNRQIDHLFHYYKPQLEYKPIPSYLVGWDFPLNPAQINGYSVGAQAVGANKSYYAWDQTIIFQQNNSGVVVSQAPTDAIRLTANSTGQFAIIQYLDKPQATKILNDSIAVHIAASTNNAAGYTANVTLLYTTDANLPNVDTGTNNSLIATISSNGIPATYNGNWNVVPRDSLGNAQFTILEGTTSTPFYDFDFSGWDLANSTTAASATFFAIVIGFEQITGGDYVDIYSVGLCSGDIATRPSPKTLSETTLDCQRYYWKTFLPGVVPAQNVGVSSGEMHWVSQAATVNSVGPMMFPVPMRATPNMTTFNPAAANAFARNITANADCNPTAASNVSGNSFDINATSSAGAVTGQVNAVHATADARLGIVN